MPENNLNLFYFLKKSNYTTKLKKVKTILVKNCEQLIVYVTMKPKLILD